MAASDAADSGIRTPSDARQDAHSSVPSAMENRSGSGSPHTQQPESSGR